ncbi:MAG: hypothetical protein QXP81_09395 [Nitrososphaerota archaeon]
MESSSPAPFVVQAPQVVCPSCQNVTRIRVRSPIECENCHATLIVADVRRDYVFIPLQHFESMRRDLEALRTENERLSRAVNDLTAALSRVPKEKEVVLGAELIRLLVEEGVPDDLGYLLSRKKPELLDAILEMRRAQSGKQQ